MRAKGMQTRGKASSRVVKGRKKTTRPRIVARKKGNLWLAILLWKLRIIRGKLYYIGYRLYPLYIFILGATSAMYIQSLYFGLPIIMRISTLNYITAITLLLLTYYTYKWMAWKMKVKRYYAQRARMMAMANNRSRGRTTVRARRYHRRSDVVTSYMVMPEGRKKHGTRRH